MSENKVKWHKYPDEKPLKMIDILLLVLKLLWKEAEKKLLLIITQESSTTKIGQRQLHGLNFQIHIRN